MPEVTEALKEAINTFAKFDDQKIQKAVNDVLDSLDNEMRISEYTLSARTAKAVGILEGIIEANKDKLAEGAESEDELKEKRALKELEEKDEEIDVEEEDEDDLDDEEDDFEDDDDTD